MKIRHAVALALSVLLATTLGFGAQSEKKASQPAYDFKELMQKVMDAWSTLDTSKAAPYYSTAKGNVFFDIAPLKYVGWTAYAEGVPKVFADYSSIKIAVGKDAQGHQRGNFAWGTATFHLDAVKKNGAKESMDGRWTVLWQKSGEDWLIVHEHVSVPLQPAPSSK